MSADQQKDHKNNKNNDERLRGWLTIALSIVLPITFWFIGQQFEQQQQEAAAKEREYAHAARLTELFSDASDPNRFAKAEALHKFAYEIRLLDSTRREQMDKLIARNINPKNPSGAVNAVGTKAAEAIYQNPANKLKKSNLLIYMQYGHDHQRHAANLISDALRNQCVKSNASTAETTPNTIPAGTYSMLLPSIENTGKNTPDDSELRYYQKGAENVATAIAAYLTLNGFTVKAKYTPRHSDRPATQMSLWVGLNDKNLPQTAFIKESKLVKACPN